MRFFVQVFATVGKKDDKSCEYTAILHQPNQTSLLRANKKINVFLEMNTVSLLKNSDHIYRHLKHLLMQMISFHFTIAINFWCRGCAFPPHRPNAIILELQ